MSQPIPVFIKPLRTDMNDHERLEDITARICDHIDSVYQENSPERVYFLMLYNIFNEFLEDLNEDDLPNDRTGYQDSLIWKKAFQLPAGCGHRHHQQAGNIQRLYFGRQCWPRKNLLGTGRHKIL